MFGSDKIFSVFLLQGLCLKAKLFWWAGARPFFFLVLFPYSFRAGMVMLLLLRSSVCWFFLFRAATANKIDVDKACEFFDDLPVVDRDLPNLVPGIKFR